jgi:hypothetical protein
MIGPRRVPTSLQNINGFRVHIYTLNKEVSTTENEDVVSHN